MLKLRGHVDRVDKFLISGWALQEDAPAKRPELQIVQAGRTVITLQPCFLFPALRAALKLSASDEAPFYHWRLWLPLSNGVKPDLPFSIVFRETGAALTLGNERTLSTSEQFDASAKADLLAATLFFPSFRRQAEVLHLGITIHEPFGNAGSELAAVGCQPVIAPPSEQGESVFAKRIFHTACVVTQQQIEGAEGEPVRIGIDSTHCESPRERLHAELRSICLPRTLFDPKRLAGPLPDNSNIHRVSGPTSDQDQYLVGGATTFRQIDLLARHYLGEGLTDLHTVVDWGVGCGRVVRQFRESAASPQRRDQILIGLDIDPVNINWCNENLRHVAQFRMLSLDGFDIPDESVDLLYGISVMTHLSEYHQHKWLREIRRILRPGGLAILTVHGEGRYYTNSDNLVLPFVEKFGFFDGVPDNAIGEDRSNYYRASYHSRGYIRDTWSQYFKLLDFIVMCNAFSQDFVVAQRSN